MEREHLRRVLAILAILAALPGCAANKPNWDSHHDKNLAYCQAVATSMEYPTVCVSQAEEIGGGRVPHSLQNGGNVQYWDLTLQEVLQLAMEHSQVIRDVGGALLRTPDAVRTMFDPSLVETDPQFGVQAALSAFDASLGASMFAEKNSRFLNDQAQGQQGWFKQDTDAFLAQLSKRAATGSQFTLRNRIDFDHNNSPANRFTGGSWSEILEGEVRHPFLRGGGLDFNRIAGPDGRPGAMNGVLLARVKTDISLADFEVGIRELVANVENAYWDLYFAYRDLDAKIRARDTALETWRQIAAQHASGRRGAEADKEAQAREQFFRFEEDVQNALAGKLVEATRTNNGSDPGTFRATPGVYSGERRLRLICGLPLNEDRVIRPIDEPASAPVMFDWLRVANEALARRVELRRQRWQVKHAELELLASKNFLLPNLDFVGRYGVRGFGKELLNYTEDDRYNPTFPDAFGNMTTMGQREWQMGMEFSMPFGFRSGHSAMRNAELQLMRSRAILQDQEQQVIRGISDGVADVDRAYRVLLTNVNRSVAAREQLAAVQTAYEENKVEFFVVLDAQRRLAEAEIAYYQARVEYALALRNVSYAKGTLLDDYAIGMTEGPWPEKAYFDAGALDRRRGRARPLNYASANPIVVSQGAVADQPVYLLAPPETLPAQPQQPQLQAPPQQQPQQPPPQPHAQLQQPQMQ